MYSIHVGVRYIGIRIAAPPSPGAWATSLTIDLNVRNGTFDKDKGCYQIELSREGNIVNIDGEF